MKITDLPLARQAAHDLEQLARLLRRQHGGRLVEDQDVGAAVERLQDLDPLLLADRDVLDPRGRVDREPVALRDLAHALARALEVEEDAAVRRLGREHDVLGDRHHRDQHEVLVHHPDAGVDRLPRRPELDLAALDVDLALVRVVEAVDDVHQRRLAGAVLAEQRVHLALEQVELDLVVREDAREALRDAAELEDGLLGHGASIDGRQSPSGPPARAAKGGHEARPSRLHVRPVLLLLDGVRDARDLARLQQRQLPGDGLLDRRGNLRAPLADADAVVLRREDRVVAAAERHACRRAFCFDAIVW